MLTVLISKCAIMLGKNPTISSFIKKKGKQAYEWAYVKYITLISETQGSSVCKYFQ